MPRAGGTVNTKPLDVKTCAFLIGLTYISKCLSAPFGRGFPTSQENDKQTQMQRWKARRCNSLLLGQHNGMKAHELKAMDNCAEKPDATHRTEELTSGQKRDRSE